MNESPRIYNLFPLLAGSVRDWETHLPRIRELGFNWVFLNPFHYPGFSGSLYAVKDYYRLHDMFQGRSRLSADALLKEFLQQARQDGLSVMMDLVINHTSKDSILVENHPEWFAREPNGDIRSPFAADPDHPDDVSRRTVWGDLAEIEYLHPADPEGLIGYWKDLVRHYAGLGFRGFRCDAAYKIPGQIWGEIIRAAREVAPETMFFAETLGCQPEEIRQLHEAGFDYLFNSAKWWDFHADWLLEQYESFRHIAPSIAFPESHDTERLAKENGGDERVSRLRYLFSAFFSAGIMMPVGYEFGFDTKLDVVRTRPEDWQDPLFDLSRFIADTNALKAATPILNEEGPQWRFTDPAAPLVGLAKRGNEAPGVLATLLNADAYHGQDIGLHELAAAMETSPERVQEITPQRQSMQLHEGSRLHLAPLEMRIFATPEARHPLSS